MQKILSRIFSVALATFIVCPAARAEGQTAGGKVKAESSRKIMSLTDFKARSKKMLPDEGLRLKSRTEKAQKGSALRQTTKHFSKSAISKKAPVNVRKAAGAIPDLIGSVVYSRNNEHIRGGIYKIPVTDSEDFDLIAKANIASDGGVLIDNVYYATNHNDIFGLYYTDVKGWDLSTGRMVYSVSPESPEAILIGESVDPTTGKIYAIGYNAAGDGLQISTIELEEDDVRVTAVAPFNYNVATMAIDGNGQMYVITFETEDDYGYEYVSASYLYKVDKTTGATELVGETGQTPEYQTGAAIDPKSGRMFWTVSTEFESFLTEVDLTTGVATPIVDFPWNTQVAGVQILPSPYADDAPDAATGISADFANGSLSGTVTFSAPTTNFDGSAASGELSYTIVVGDQTLTGVTSYGDTVTENVTVSMAGNYTIAVSTSNAAGTSPLTTLDIFIGNGIPVPPAPVLSYAEGEFTLTWDAVTTSADGGYIDPSAVTYTVYDMDGKVVASDITATSVTIPMEEPAQITMFSYSVEASCNGLVSSKAESNVVLVGKIVPPYENRFNSPEDCSMFTILDINGDGNTWQYSQGAMRCDYSIRGNMDDWLISPPITLKAGEVYEVSVDARCYESSYPERFEMTWGFANSAEAQTNVLIEPTVLESTDYQTYTAKLIATTDGQYYIGIHGISDFDKWALYVDNFSVSAGASINSPAQPSDLKVTAGAAGGLNATISFNAPATNLGGATLSGITKIEIARNGKVIDTRTGVAPGEEVSLTDAVEESGFYTYSVTAYNDYGAGDTASATVHIGLGAPDKVSGITLSENGNEYTFNWIAPTKDIYGTEVAASQLTYEVYYADISGYLIPLASGLTEPTFTWTYDQSFQNFEELVITAVTEGGMSAPESTGLFAAGPDYDGIFESFANGQLHYCWGLDPIEGNASWNIFDDSAFNITSYDKDNGLVACQGRNYHDAARLYSGKITLEGMADPTVSFYVYVDADNDENEVSVSVSEPNTYNWVDLKTFTVSSLGEEGWHKVTVPLTGYEGKTIQVGIAVTLINYTTTLIDAIKVGSTFADDLKAINIAAPAQVMAGDDFSVSVDVYNDGRNNAEAYYVELYANGEFVDSKPGTTVAPDETVTVEFVQSLSPIATKDMAYYGKVVYAADLATDNNITQTISVAPKHSNLPAVSDLSGEATPEGNVLTWNEPDLSSYVPEGTTEDFEDADPFTENYKDWIFVDVDKAGIGGFQDVDLPFGLNTPHSWFVFDSSDDQFDERFEAASGSKYLACLFRWDGGTVDDWAISPALYGCAQTISFMAKNYSDTFTEEFEIWYSTGSTNVEDFIKLTDVNYVYNNRWTEFRFDLPEGAGRFAIRSCSTDQYMLMVDDVNFLAADADITLTLVGYDVYRNGVKLNDNVLAATTYTDADIDLNVDYTYNVVAVYTVGTSAPSAACNLTLTGLDSVFADVNIAAGKDKIVITGAEGLPLQVVGADGKVFFSGIAEEKNSVTVVTGVYVVKVGDKVAKVAVR